jgi:hypothetical protein
MRVLLLNGETGCYYAGDLNWTRDKASALNFGAIEQATRINAREQIGATDVVLVHNKPPCTVTLPITRAGVKSLMEA